jgi:hypothetical protein
VELPAGATEFRYALKLKAARGARGERAQQNMPGAYVLCTLEELNDAGVVEGSRKMRGCAISLVAQLN